jgi:serine phosphatase RsbU (regulator of sigma subunit)
MERFRSILYIAVPSIWLLGIFVFDVIGGATGLEITGGAAIREASILISFLFIFLYIRKNKSTREQSLSRAAGVLLVKLVIVLFIESGISAFLFGSPQIREMFNSEGTRSIPAFLRFITLVSGIVLGTFSIDLLLTLKNFLFYKRRKETFRNFVVLVILLLASSIAASIPFLTANTIIAYLMFALTIAAIIYSSFRQNWIVYLSRREKIYTLVYSALLFLGFLYLSMMMSGRMIINVSLKNFSESIQTFVQLSGMYGAVYFGMSFVSTLFHMPIAEVYERKQSELSSLHNLSRLTSRVLDFQDLVDTVTTMTMEVIGAKSCWLEVARAKQSPGDDGFEIVSRKNLSTEFIRSIGGSHDTSLRQLVLKSGDVLMIDEVKSDKRLKHADPSTFDFGSMICVPLLMHGELTGCLYATKEIEYGFDHDDTEVLTTFAEQVSIAIENSKLIARSLERERFQREIMLAQEMQHKLLPQTMPRFEKLEFAAASEMSMEVGGDYYDFVSDDDGKFSLIVADVSGKGITAAFYMAEAKGIFQSLSRFGLSPQEFVKRANDAATGSLDKRAFISMIYSTIDTRKGVMRIVRAGHCPMIHVTGGKVKLLRPAGMGIGLTDNRIFDKSIEEAAVNLKIDDVCIYYTDGVTEARNIAGEEYGYQRLMDIAMNTWLQSAEEIKQRIIDDVHSYSTGSEFSDDLTLVVLKWKG